ncbi:MAG: hypothetical protein Q7R49_00950 [Candidatus Daviesbacteria bacterium]|nr:hypothetical protein [Candidatus Daviesbacteria bacterium]
MTPTNRYSRYYTFIQPTLRLPIVKKYGAYTLTIITIVIFIIFAIKPTIETISVLQQKLANSEDILQKVNQKVQNLQSGRQNYSALGTNVIGKINTSIPLSVSLKSLVDPLETAANTNQASISALQVDPIVISERDPNSTSFNLSKIIFTFNTEGDFQTLLRVLKQIQNSPRLTEIDSIVFNKAADSKTLLMSVNGKAYYLK